MRREFLVSVNGSSSDAVSWKTLRVWAETVEVTQSGTLLFSNSRFITKAFAAGHWRDVEIAP